MKKLLPFGVFLIGFTSAHFVFNFASPQPWKHRVFEKSDINQLAAYAQDNSQKSVAIVSNCILGHYDTKNDLTQNLKVINKVAGLFSEIANLTAQKNNLNYDFINFSRTHFSPRDLTSILFNVLQNSKVDTVVFNLDYNSMHMKQSTDLASTLEASLTLKKISEIYPDLKGDAEKLIQYLEKDPLYKTAVQVYGPDYKELADSQTLMMPRYDTEGMNSYWLAQDKSNLADIQSRIKFETLKDNLKVFDGLTSTLQFLIFTFSGQRQFELARIKGELNAEMADSAFQENHPALDAPILSTINDESKKYLDPELYLNWLNLFLKVAKKNNKEFVYFFTPSLEATTDSTLELKNTYIEPVTNLVLSHHFKVLDLSSSPVIEAKDLITRNSLISYTIAINSSAFYKLYRQPNLVGKIKLAEELVGFLKGQAIRESLLPSKSDVPNTKSELRFTDVHSLINSERQTIYSLWSQTVTPEYLPYFSLNQITPHNYFNREIFESLKMTEISWLNGQGQLAFMCARVTGGCGPSHHLRSNVFQKIGDF